MVGTLGIVLAAVIVGVVVVVYLVWVLASNRRAGASGLSRSVRLTCPKCQGLFDYTLVPGASATSLRLGVSRYMSCPLCHSWSVIRVAGAPPAGPEPSAESSR
jgi:hypothetical protein